MDPQHVGRLTEYYNRLNQEFASLCRTTSKAVVSMNIFYHMPDHPHVLRDYVYQYDDVFGGGLDLEKKFSQLAKATAYVRSEEQADGIIDFLKNNVAEAILHLRKLDKTDDHFEIPFNQYAPSKHPEIIESVPLVKTREFLHFWQREIEGPLHTVAITFQRQGHRARLA